MELTNKFLLVLSTLGLLFQKASTESMIDYNLLSTIIDKSYKSTPYQYVLVADSTDVPKDFVYKVRSVKVKNIFEAKKSRSSLQSWESFLDDFRVASSPKIRLEHKFTTDTQLRFVPNNYNLSVYWPSKPGKVSLKYAGGINVITPVFYSEDKQKALCAINLVFPDEGEGETIFLFEKQKNGWILVYDTVLTVTAR